MYPLYISNMQRNYDKLGKAQFNSLRFLLDSGSIFFIITGKNRPKFTKETCICWNKQGGCFNTNYTSKVQVVLSELYEAKSVGWNLHKDDKKITHKYDIKLGHDILYKLNIYLCFYGRIIMLNVGK